MRALADLTWRAHLQPAPPGWLDMGLAVPTMDTAPGARAARLDAATFDADERAARAAGRHARDRPGLDTRRCAPHAGGPFRVREFLTGVGRRLT